MAQVEYSTLKHATGERDVRLNTHAFALCHVRIQADPLMFYNQNKEKTNLYLFDIQLHFFRWRAFHDDD